MIHRSSIHDTKAPRETPERRTREQPRPYWCGKRCHLVLKKTIGSLINAPNHEKLLTKPSDLPPEPRWERLASAIIPPVPDGFPIATLRTTSAAALEVLKESVALLAADLSGLRLKPISQSTALALQDSIQSVRDIAAEDRESREESLRAARQLQIYHKVGPEWARVTPLEHLFLSWCAAPDEPVTTAPSAPATEPPLDRKIRSSAPDSKLLEPLGLVWAWSEKRAIWEPAPRSSKYKNSTLFDLASHFFSARLKDERHPLGARTAKLYDALLEARITYENTRHDDQAAALRTLRAQQGAILQDNIGA